jgi:hypothetical protein
MTGIKRILLGFLLTAVVLPLVVAAPAMAAPSAAPGQGHPICFVITQADNGKTFDTPIPSCDILQLSGLRWSTPTVDGDAVSLVPIPAPYGDQSWQILAEQPGEATITSWGRPMCTPGQVCPDFIVLFRVHIVVLATPAATT